MKKTICIIVDHPVRDLSGILHLISKINKKKFTFFLVPFYNFREVYIIRPHLVILNHTRNIYTNFIKALNSININILVLDTEGGMVTDDLVDEYILFSNLENNINFVKGYCVWSKKIKTNLLKKININKNKLYVTGNPRFNYLQSIKSKKGRQILINLNFATINPRFQSIKKEKELLIKQGKSLQWINHYVKDQYSMRKKFIEMIFYISKKFKSKDIVIRPHPYENQKYYENIFYKEKNVLISKNRTIEDDVNNSLVVIQNNCGTSIDAILLKKPVIFYQPFKSKFLDQKLILDISMSCRSILNISKKIIEIDSSKKTSKHKSLELISDNFSSLKNNTKIFEKLFYKNTNNNIVRQNFLLLAYKNKELIFCLKTIIKIFLGKKVFGFINKNFKQKVFSLYEVKNNIQRMNCNNKNLNNTKLSKVGFLLKLFDLYSIKIEKKNV